MKKKILISLIGIIIISAVFLIAFFLLRNQLSEIHSGIPDLLNIEKIISTPPPLKKIVDTQQGFLTKSGVLRYTNEQRTNSGLKPLIENIKLDASAKLKIDDMFLRQYFEHTSPIGVGVGDLAQRVSYEYIIIGENLAMGNFKNSEELVKAWMDSPGHRENILNPKYKEIGIAVLEGEYQGGKIWMAVQHFGASMSECIKPNENLKAEINSAEIQLEQLKNYLNVLRIELENMKSQINNKRELEEYNQKVETYNTTLEQYNYLVEEVKKLIQEYNNQVLIFNQCLQE